MLDIHQKASFALFKGGYWVEITSVPFEGGSRCCLLTSQVLSYASHMRKRKKAAEKNITKVRKKAKLPCNVIHCGFLRNLLLYLVETLELLTV